MLKPLSVSVRLSCVCHFLASRVADDYATQALAIQWQSVSIFATPGVPINPKIKTHPLLMVERQDATTTHGDEITSQPSHSHKECYYSSWYIPGLLHMNIFL